MNLKSGTSYKRILSSLLVGVLLSGIFIGSAECFFRFNTHHMWFLPLPKTPPSSLSDFDLLKTDFLKNKLRMHPISGWNHPMYSSKNLSGYEKLDFSKKGRISCCIMNDYVLKGGTYLSTVTTDITHRSIYSVTYTYDIHGRRRTPDPLVANENILMFGDSFTLGEGVNDEETTAFQLGTLRPNSKVYNLGLAGGSPNQFLYEAELTSPTRLASIDTDIPTSILYIYMDHHLERLVARSSAQAWIHEQPYYVRKNNKLVFQGSFNAREPLNSLYEIIKLSHLLKYFNVEFPPRFTKKHFNLFALAMKQAHESLRFRFPNSRFYLALYPGASHYYGQQIATASRQLNISVLDYSRIDMYQATTGRAFLPLDGHPTPISHFILALLLNTDIPKASSQ
jgi:hypothetical protein